MVFTPSYQYIYDPIWKLGRNAIKMPLINTDGYYTIDFAAFEKAAAAGRDHADVLQPA